MTKLYRNGYLGRPCPTCGRDLGEVEHPVFAEDGISSIPYCSSSCKANGVSARKSPEKTSSGTFGSGNGGNLTEKEEKALEEFWRTSGGG